MNENDQFTCFENKWSKIGLGIGVFPKWSRILWIHWIQQIQRIHWIMNWVQFNCLLCQLCLWHSGRVPVYHTGDSGFEPSNLFKLILFLSLNSVNSVKTLRENSNKCQFKCTDIFFVTFTWTVREYSQILPCSTPSGQQVSHQGHLWNSLHTVNEAQKR